MAISGPGVKGNLTESEGYILANLIVTAVTILLTVYFLVWQTYVMWADVIISSVLLVVYGLNEVLAFSTLARITSLDECYITSSVHALTDRTESLGSGGEECKSQSPDYQQYRPNTWLPTVEEEADNASTLHTVNDLNHECPGTSVEASQLIISRVIPSYCQRGVRESLTQCVEGGVGQGPRAQSGSVENCLLCLGFLAPASLHAPHPPPSPFPLSPSLSLVGPYAQNLRLISSNAGQSPRTLSVPYFSSVL
ncbi:hypothetical protein PAMP_019820 [Pampus punctatissimus]